MYEDDVKPLEFVATAVFLVLAAILAVSVADVDTTGRCRPACQSVGLDTVRSAYPECICGGSGVVRRITP